MENNNEYQRNPQALLELINKEFLDSKGRLNSNKIKQTPEVLRAIYKFTDKIPNKEKIKLRDLIWCIKNNYNEVPKCKTCEKEIPLKIEWANRKYPQGYIRKYCSLKCFNNDPEIKAKASEREKAKAKERLEKLGKKLPQAVIVRYPVLGKNKEGVSLALLKMELKDVSIGIKAIRGLSPEENTGLRSLFKTYSRITALALIATPFAAVGGYFAGTVLAPLIEGVVLRSSLSEMLDTTRTFLNTVQKGGMGSIVEVLEKVLGGVVGRVTRRGRQRREFLNSMAELLKAAIKAKPYIDKPEYEGIVDEVAAKWGLDAASFKKFIDNLYTATTSRLVREEELRKLRELRDREFVERLGKIMEEKREPLLREFSEKLEGIWGELRKLDEKVKELEE